MNIKHIAVIVTIIAIAIITGTWYLTSMSGYKFEVTGTLSLENEWQISDIDTTVPEPDYSLFPPGSDEEGIGFLQTDEVIIKVQINNHTYSQNLGNYDEVTNNTNNPHFNVMISHIPNGEYTYQVFLYRSYGIVLKDLVLKDQMEGTIEVK